MQNFKHGDFVRHIDGGSVMFVESVNGNKVICSWIGADKSRHQDEFLSQSLKLKTEMNINLSDWLY